MTGTDDEREVSCPFCAEKVQPKAIKCKHCGSAITVSPPSFIASNKSPPNPVLMALLGLCIVAGIPQIVLGQKTKGWVCLLVGIAITVPAGGLPMLILLPLNAIDAYLVAKKIKQGLPVTEWECFPST
jgi:hypothetical protein